MRLRLNVFGARMAADATPLLPLSRQDADAVFQKIEAHFEVTQSLPQDFVASLAASTQYSFNHALLTSEQFGIVGATQLSGFTAGALVGDQGWVIRGELSRPITIDAIQSTFAPYGFVAWGERAYESPTILEIGTIHALNYGGGLRFYPNYLAAIMLNGYGFIEWSRRTATDPRLDGDRIFVGGVLRY